MPITEAAELTNIGILLAFARCVHRGHRVALRNPEIERGFRTPGMSTIPLIGVVSSIWLITYLTTTTWLRFAGW